MNTSTIVVLALLGVVSCSHIVSQITSYAGKGYTPNFRGLHTTAQGSAKQAHYAVSSQSIAALQASYIAKSTFALAAKQAAATAAVALVGKQILLDRLLEQKTDAVRILDLEIFQYQLAEEVATAALTSAQNAVDQGKILSSALNHAEQTAVQAQKTAELSAVELTSQINMATEAEKRLKSTQHQLEVVRMEFLVIQEAAEGAAASAYEAQSIASEAAAHATIQLQRLNAG